MLTQVKFGAHDGPTCPACTSTMYVTRRTPHPLYGSAMSCRLLSVGRANMKLIEAPTEAVSRI